MSICHCLGHRAPRRREGAILGVKHGLPPGQGGFWWPLILVFGILVLALGQSPASGLRPNLLWITSEDHGPHMGCYGDRYATTPNVDALAAKGLVYTHAWSCAPVCAPARTTLISGLFAPSAGAEHMRSLVDCPVDKPLLPQLLRAAGYYCSNNAKEDYNLDAAGKVWDASSKRAHWSNRPAGQPFFAVFNSEKSHESKLRIRPHARIHDPALVPIPAYHPDRPEVREDWAQYYDTVSEADADAGLRLQELADAGLTEDTVVFYFSDHGSGMPRNKRWPYNAGLQIALVVYIPEKFKELRPADYKPGGRTDRLVSFADFAPTILSLAGVRPPDWLQGGAFLGKFQAAAHRFLHGFRGRMDERYDLVRSVTDGRYVYIRNYLPHKIYGQHIGYMWQTPTTRVWQQLHGSGKLTSAQDAFWRPKPPEELYDLQNDPDEVKNLARSGEHQRILNRLRKAQREHVLDTRDTGLLTEAEAHHRAGGDAIYDMGHDEKRYRLKRILAMAEAASSLRTDDLPRLRRGLGDPDSAVRYWAMLGFLMRGSTAVRPALDDLRPALRDESPSVRIAAAETLGRYGPTADREHSLDVLRTLAPADTNGAYVSMLALNAIDALGTTADELKPCLRTISTDDPKAPARANTYAARLVQDILGELPATAPQNAEPGKTNAAPPAKP